MTTPAQKISGILLTTPGPVNPKCKLLNINASARAGCRPCRDLNLTQDLVLVLDLDLVVVLDLVLVLVPDLVLDLTWTWSGPRPGPGPRPGDPGWYLKVLD